MIEETGVCSHGHCKGICAGVCDFMDEGPCDPDRVILSDVIIAEMTEMDFDFYEAFVLCQFGSCIYYFGPLQDLMNQVPLVYDANFQSDIRDEKFMQDMCLGFLNQTESDIHCLTAGIYKNYFTGNHYNLEVPGDGPDGQIFPEVDDVDFYCTYRYTCAPLALQVNPSIPMGKRSEPTLGSDTRPEPPLSNGRFTGHRPSRRPTVVPTK
jgi:hypothetical protein